jgi:hypothetical protein
MTLTDDRPSKASTVAIREQPTLLALRAVAGQSNLTQLDHPMIKFSASHNAAFRCGRM